VKNGGRFRGRQVKQKEEKGGVLHCDVGGFQKSIFSAAGKRQRDRERSGGERMLQYRVWKKWEKGGQTLDLGGGDEERDGVSNKQGKGGAGKEGGQGTVLITNNETQGRPHASANPFLATGVKRAHP